MKLGVCQLCSGDDPAQNVTLTLGYMREAARLGADLILTPEVTNIVSLDRAHQAQVLRHEDDDPTLAALRAEAKALGVWLSIGSLALKTGDADGRFANRSFLIDPAGEIVARYDKMHMFVTGAAHWEPLLRARAIETGCFVIASAQTGTHASTGKSRETYGHSLVISPWGEVLLDAGTETGVHIVAIDLQDVAKARGRIPSLRHGVDFEGP